MGRVMGLKALNGLVHVRLFGRESAPPTPRDDDRDS